MLQVGIDSTLLRFQCNVTITNFKATLIHEWNIPRFFSIWTSTCRRMWGFWYSVNKVLFISTVFCEIRLLPMNLKNGCFRFLFPLILGNSYNIKCVKTMPWFWQIICICNHFFHQCFSSKTPQDNSAYLNCFQLRTTINTKRRYKIIISIKTIAAVICSNTIAKLIKCIVDTKIFSQETKLYAVVPQK